MRKIILLLCLLCILLLSAQYGFSQSTSWKGTTNTFWNNAANWTNGIPSITKDAILGDASFTGINQPKVNVASTCRSLIVGGVKATTVTFTRALTIAGNFTINNNGTVIHPAVVSYLAGDFINNGIYSAAATTATLTFNGTNQSISGSSNIVFRRLTIKAGAVVTLSKDIRVDSASSVLAVYGVLEPAMYKVTSTVATRVYDTARLKVNTAAFSANYALTGSVTLYAGSIVEYASSTTDQVVSSGYSYSTLMISGNSTKSLVANLPLLYAKAALYGKIVINSGIFDIGTFTANRGTTKVGGELYIANGAVLKVGGLNNFPINFVTKTIGVSSTVEYNGAAQTVSPQAYGNLLLSTAGIKTATLAFSTAGNFTIINATLNTNAIPVTHTIAGNFTMSGGAITGTNNTFTLNGTMSQSLILNSNLSRLNINNTGAAINLGSDITVTNTLSFINGNIQTGNYNVIIPAAATVTGAAQNTGWVAGNLKKNITAGSSVFKTFEVGAGSYSPVSVLFTSVSISGDLTANTYNVDEPEINYSGLNPAKTVNRFWSLNNSGILFSNASVIFNWVAADVDAGAITSNFKTGLYNGTNWILVPASSPSAASIQANGVTSLGNFSVGETINKSTWTGDAMTADWFTPKNWLGLIPSTSNPTYIPNGLAAGRVYPVIASGTGIVKDLTVDNTATLTVNAGTLRISGALISAGNVTASAGNIMYIGSSLQTIASNSYAGNLIKNLAVNNNLSLDDKLIISGTLTISNGKTFVTNDNLVLKSDANGTAKIAALPVNSAGNATAFITGNVSIERYIPARKAWRLLSAPIKTGTATTLAASWQEGAYASSFAPNPNPHPGYGVHIAGGPVANGFDQSLTNLATLKIFDNASNNFVPLPVTPGTFATVTSYPGYFVYIRGDRSIDLSQGSNAAVTSTTLRMKGPVNTGNYVSTVNATHFTVLGNPYPSPIDFGTITKNNVKNSFYLWDPKLAGANGLGAYVTVSWNSSTHVYDVTSSASAVSQYIPSGEAILVESLDALNTGTVTIKESDKTANGSDYLFGRGASAGQKLRTNLYAKNPDSSFSLLDGSLTTYADNNSGNLDNDDIRKITSYSENISLQRQGSLLAIERRKTITDTDTSFLNIANLKRQTYKLEITAERLDMPGCTALLKDNFSSELNNTALNVNGTTDIIFTVTANPASNASDRFNIVFTKPVALAFSFRAEKATVQQKNINVEWQTINESGIKSYDVEKSDDGVSFIKATTLFSKVPTTGKYSWVDLNNLAGTHYYRIKALASSGEVMYSRVLNTVIAEAIVSSEMSVYPNPVKNNTLAFQRQNLAKGNYVIRIFNVNGQIMKQWSLEHNGGDIKYSLPLDDHLPAGKYQVTLSGNAVTLSGNAVKYSVSFIKE